MKDIAVACGVSIATVSNILNNNGKATEKTRAMVKKKAEELNYVPNFMAKNLKQRENKNIGIITEDLTIFHAPIVVDGITACLEKYGYHFLLGNIRLFQKHGDDYYQADDYNNYIVTELRMMLSKQVAGIIYVQGHSHEMKLPEIDVPVVMAYGMCTNSKIPHVIYNDCQGAYDAVMKLLKSGHRLIGVICGSKISYHTKCRLQGYQKALYDSKILYNPDLIVSGDWSRKSGYEAVKKLIAHGISAIFAMNDIMAGGVYDYARQHNLSIGQDICIVGFDNREICEAFYPELSSVRLPLFEIGWRSAEILIHILQNESNQIDSEYLIPCEYIKRKSE